MAASPGISAKTAADPEIGTVQRQRIRVKPYSRYLNAGVIKSHVPVRPAVLSSAVPCQCYVFKAGIIPRIQPDRIFPRTNGNLKSVLRCSLHPALQIEASIHIAEFIGAIRHDSAVRNRQCLTIPCHCKDSTAACLNFRTGRNGKAGIAAAAGKSGIPADIQRQVFIDSRTVYCRSVHAIYVNCISFRSSLDRFYKCTVFCRHGIIYPDPCFSG